jgi:hypothetical protein
MNKAVAGWTGIAMLLTAAVEAGTPIELTDRQMAIVTAGSAKAVSALQTSASGRGTATQTWVGNIAAARPAGDFAQSRAAVLASGTGNASLSADIFSSSTVDGLGASAASAAAATGDLATVHDATVTTAISTPAGSGRIGIANSLAVTTSFSAGKTAR